MSGMDKPKSSSTGLPLQEHPNSAAIELKFYQNIADKIVTGLRPASVLQIGSGAGGLIEALRAKGVAAEALEFSEEALAQVKPEVLGFCKVGSLLEPLPHSYDLIICLDVLPQLYPQEAKVVLQNLAAATDNLLFSFKPNSYANPNYRNLQELPYWVELLAQVGFWHDLDFDASFINPYTLRFSKSEKSLPELAARYEWKLWQANRQIEGLREAGLAAHLGSNGHSPVRPEESGEMAEQLKQARSEAETAQTENRRLSRFLRQQEQQIQRLSRDTSRYHNDFLNTKKEYERVLQYVRRLEDDRANLQKTLGRLEADLRALQNTRTVRTSRKIGQLISDPLRVTKALVKGPLEAALDLPVINASLPGYLELQGWAYSRSGRIAEVEVRLDNQRLGLAEYGLERPDVLAVRTWQPLSACGFTAEFKLDSSVFAPGPKTLTVQISDTGGHRVTLSRPVILTEATTETRAKALSKTSTILDDELLEYQTWIANNEPDAAALMAQRNQALLLTYRPLISVITPVYNPPLDILRATIDSVLNQTYPNWELCLAEGDSPNLDVRTLLQEYADRDARIKVKFIGRNLGISGNSNEALQMATGELIALLDHDDEFAPNALYENVLVLNEHPDADMIYSDEDKYDLDGNRCLPFFKPGWAPDYFRAVMYTCHLGVYRTSLVQEIGGFRSRFDGAQDYDLVLRLTEQTGRIHHIPKILYHWRMTENSTAYSEQAKEYAFQAQERAVAEHLRRIGWDAEVLPGADGTLRVKRHLTEFPKVSILIPTRDQAGVLKRAIDSILKLSTYPNYEILIIDNDSARAETFEYFQSLETHSNIRVLSYPGEFNFSAVNNFAAAQASGEMLLLLNNDVEVISPDWLEAMVEQAIRPEVGAVGARLLYPDGRLQHGGVILGIGGVAGHSHKLLPRNQTGYFKRAATIQDWSAVTAACLMVRAELYREVGGLDEQNLTVAFNDVDFCLRLREKGRLIVWTPYAELYHYESLSRGMEAASPHKVARFQKEIQYMFDRWGDMLYDDPYYNPNLTLEEENFDRAPISRSRRV